MVHRPQSFDEFHEAKELTNGLMKTVFKYFLVYLVCLLVALGVAGLVIVGLVKLAMSVI